MRVCPSCGGILGRDCFNPEECQWITDQMARQDREDFEAKKHHLQEPQCPEPHSPSLPETDQPVPEEADKYIEAMAVECAHNVYEYKKNAGLLGNGYLFSDMIQAARGTAEAMYKRDQATIADLYERLAFYEKLVQFDGDLLPAKPIDAQDWIDKAAEKEQKGKDLHYGGYRQVALDIYNRMSERIANNAWEWIQKHTDLQSRLSQVITACQPVKNDFLVGHILKLAEGKKEGKV